jgi:hypothetical protein
MKKIYKFIVNLFTEKIYFCEYCGEKENSGKNNYYLCGHFCENPKCEMFDRYLNGAKIT